MSNDSLPGYPPILNRGEPFAYLPADIGRQLHYFQYVASATTGMFVWELLRDLPNLYKFFIATRPTLSAAVYLISRLSTLLYTAISLQFLIVGGNCAGLYLAIGICWVLASACTTMLFFLRVQAIYRDNLLIVGSFAFLWLSVIGGAITVPIAGRKQVVHLLPHETFCISLGIAYPAYTGSSIIIPAAHDILVYIAVSYHLFSAPARRGDTTWKDRVGAQITSLFTALSQDGQKFYMIAVAAHISILAAFFAPSVPMPYRVMSTLILLNFVNSMACRVYCDISKGQVSGGTSVANRNTRLIGHIGALHATPRNRDDAIIDMEISKSHINGSPTPDGSTDIELSDRSLKTVGEVYGHA